MLSFKLTEIKLASFPQTIPYKLWYTFYLGTWKTSFSFWGGGCGWHRKEGIAKNMLASDLHVLKNTKNTLREVLV